jgi:hypothetical protein
LDVGSDAIRGNRYLTLEDRGEYIAKNYNPKYMEKGGTDNDS